MACGRHAYVCLSQEASLARQSKFARLRSEPLPFKRADRRQVLTPRDNLNPARCAEPSAPADVTMLDAGIEDDIQQAFTGPPGDLPVIVSEPHSVSAHPATFPLR